MSFVLAFIITMHACIASSAIMEFVLGGNNTIAVQYEISRIIQLYSNSIPPHPIFTEEDNFNNFSFMRHGQKMKFTLQMGLRQHNLNSLLSLIISIIYLINFITIHISIWSPFLSVAVKYTNDSSSSNAAKGKLLLFNLSLD